MFNNMDVQRVILFGALGLVLVMIWQSWTEFQRQHAGVPAVTATGQSATSAAAQAAAAAAQDVPTAPPLPVTQGQADGIAVAAAAESAAPARLINVTTDLVRAQIDLRGGDVVRLELRRHPVSIDRPQEPFVLMHRDARALFVAQSGLIGADPQRQYPDHSVAYTATAREYDLGARPQMEIVLDWRAPDGVDYQKVFRFTRDSYRIDIDFRVHNRSAKPWRGYVYGQLKQTEIEQEGSMGFLGRLPSYHGAAIYTAEDQYDKISYGDMRDEILDLPTAAGWVSMLQHYFVTVWLPHAGVSDVGDAGEGDSEGGDGVAGYQFFSGVSGAGARRQYRIGYKTTTPVRLESGQRGVLNMALFAGPKEQHRLRRQHTEGLLLTVDYGWLTPIADPLFWLLDKIHGVVQNWGWSIVLLTLLVKAVFYPLSATSYKSMAKMKKLQPRMKTLKERYGDDKQKFQQEMMKLYKTEKVNPAGGCLPILVQIPVFIALYWTLLESVELRQASFMLWLQDLSIPDPYFVLPLIMGASMLAQHFLNPAPVDPLQKKIMMAMPIVFTVFFLWFPAGLVLYWVVNNLLSIAQQYYVTRKYA